VTRRAMDPERLERELYVARRTIVEISPEPVRDLFRSAILCGSIREATDWERRAIDAVLVMAEPVDNGLADHAYCPLCGRGSSAPYSGGFVYPEGLTRHLEGRSARRCPVMEQVWGLCIDAVWASGNDPRSGTPL